ncbi:MAG: hypothetical protein N2C12_00130, partial [Planctomycetales bacterium]
MREWIAEGLAAADRQAEGIEDAQVGEAEHGDRVVAPGPNDTTPKRPGKPLDVLRQQQLDLEKSLMVNYWRVALAYLLAEKGEMAAAIELLELVQAKDELSPADYQALADWYLVVDRRKDSERAMVEMFKTSEDHVLERYISSRLDPWWRSDVDLPTELDKKVLLVFRALFEKSTYPQNYLWQLQRFYSASRDFRLLSVMADAMVGQTAVKIYPFLSRMNSVLAEIRDEATADSLREYLVEVRKRAKTTIDRRALDLLEVQVERRAAEVLDQPGPHVDAALAAMQRAFKREWSEGEPRLMAELLAALGKITQPELTAEQQRQVRVLHERAEHGSLDRLYIAYCGAQIMWYNNQADSAIRHLGAALAEYQQATGKPFSNQINAIVSSYVSYLKQRDHYGQAEKFLLVQLQRPNNQKQNHWLTLQLYNVYREALDDGGAVSIGRGEPLYLALEK